MNKHIEQYYQQQIEKDKQKVNKNFYSELLKHSKTNGGKFPTRTKRTMEDRRETHLYPL